MLRFAVVIDMPLLLKKDSFCPSLPVVAKNIRSDVSRQQPDDQWCESDGERASDRVVP